MTLLFLRHALAEERHNGLDHPDRRLTNIGIRQSRAMGSFAQRQTLGVQAILSSPYRRARETADHFASRLENPPSIEIVPWLQIYTASESTVAEILTIARAGCITVFVGHEPDFSLIIGLLLGMKPAAIKIRKASLTYLTCVNPETRQFQLKWSITPDLLRSK
jgi:phosphohistidine phosphatase